MATAEIGNLRISLSMDSAAFRKGATDAQGTLATLERRFGVSAGTIGKAVGVIGAAVAGAFSVKAIGGALEFADAMGKAAQSAGLSVETYSALAHVADLAGVSHDEFSSILNRFNKNLRDSREFATDTGLALAAMGVSARTAGGEVKSIDTIIGDVAEKFAGYEESLAKVNLAQDLFGAKAGQRLIPFLNQGRDGIEKLKEEAAKLGVVIGEDFAKKAEAFNDEWRKLGAAFQGLALDIGQIVVPPLLYLLEKLVDFAKFQREGAANTKAWLDAFKSDAAKKALEEISLRVMELHKQEADLLATPMDQWSEAQVKSYKRLRAEMAGLLAERETLRSQNREDIGPFKTTTNAPSGKELEIDLEKQWKDAVEASSEAIKNDQERVEAWGAALQANVQPLDELGNKLQELNRISKVWGADQVKLQNLQQMAVWKTANDYAGAGAAIAGALSALFKKSKTLAIGSAIMNTAQAITAALKNPPGPPFSYAYAAAAAITGVAQIQAIRSASESGGGSVPSVSGSGGTVDGGSGDSTPAPATPEPRTLFVEGISGGGLFTPSIVRDLIERLNAETRNGAVLVVK